MLASALTYSNIIIVWFWTIFWFWKVWRNLHFPILQFGFEETWRFEICFDIWLHVTVQFLITIHSKIIVHFRIDSLKFIWKNNIHTLICGQNPSLIQYIAYFANILYNILIKESISITYSIAICNLLYCRTAEIYLSLICWPL